MVILLELLKAVLVPYSRVEVADSSVVQVTLALSPVILVISELVLKVITGGSVSAVVVNL